MVKTANYMLFYEKNYLQKLKKSYNLAFLTDLYDFSTENCSFLEKKDI